MLYIVGFVVVTIILIIIFGCGGIWACVWRLLAAAFFGAIVWLLIGTFISPCIPQEKSIMYVKETYPINNNGDYFSMSVSKGNNTICHYCSYEDGEIQIENFCTDKSIKVTHGSDKAELVAYTYRFKDNKIWGYMIAYPKMLGEYEFRLP
jgi:hypothetical protein|nr:MAG TPA: hypothetical protein [Bacteriophage sp.]